MSWFIWILLVFNIPIIAMGSARFFTLLVHIIDRWRGGNYGELHVDCPRCWRRLRIGYRPTESDGTGGRSGDAPEGEIECRCGMTVFVRMAWQWEESAQ